MSPPGPIVNCDSCLHLLRLSCPCCSWNVSFNAHSTQDGGTMVTSPHLMGKKIQALKGEVTFFMAKAELDPGGLTWPPPLLTAGQHGRSLLLSGAPGSSGGCAGPVQSYLPRAEVTLQPSQDPPTILAPGFGITRQSGHPGKARSARATEHEKQLGERVGCSHGDRRSSNSPRGCLEGASLHPEAETRAWILSPPLRATSKSSGLHRTPSKTEVPEISLPCPLPPSSCPQRGLSS